MTRVSGAVVQRFHDHGKQLAYQERQGQLATEHPVMAGNAGQFVLARAKTERTRWRFAPWVAAAVLVGLETS